MQIWAEPEKSTLPICNYSQILYQFLTFTQNLKRSLAKHQKTILHRLFHLYNIVFLPIIILSSSLPMMKVMPSSLDSPILSSAALHPLHPAP